MESGLPDHNNNMVPPQHNRSSAKSEQQRHSGKADYARLTEAWSARFNAPPPKNLSRRLITGALAYEAERDVHGGLNSQIRKSLRALASENPAAGRAPKLTVGTRLVREWNGTTYVLDVTENGFKMGRREFKTLSAAANAITGAHWNGRAFFGLVKRKSARKPS
jgi:hypothetical protein